MLLSNIQLFESYNYPDHIFLPRGMISVSEAKLLYFIAKNNTSSPGAIIDAGSFVGASTYALAAGLNSNPNREKNTKIYSFDLFTANDDYVVQFLQNNFFVKRDRSGRIISKTLTVDKGYDYFNVYRFQVQRYFDFVVPVKGDIKLKKWNGLPISLLFLDVCKNIEINSHVFKEFFPALLPGVSIIVQQDYHHIYHPYIHVTMQAVKDYCSCIINKVNCSRVYRLEKEIPESVLRKVVDYDFTLNEKMDLLNGVISDANEDERPLLHVVLARELYMSKAYKALEKEIEIILKSYNTNEGKAYWFTELKNGCPGFVESF